MTARTVLIVDCYIELPGAAANFEQYLDRSECESCLIVHGQRPKKPIASYSGVVITGSAASVTDRLPWVDDLQALILNAIRLDIPVLGVCFGHQLLADALGGTVQKASIPEVGTVQIDLIKDSVITAGLPKRFSCFVSHEDEVVSVGDMCEVFARSEQCAVQAFRHRTAAAWGIQFHPEMPESERLELLNYRAKRHPELELDVEKQYAQRVEQSELAQTIFGHFLAACR